MRETRWRVVEADGRAYPPNSDPLRSYEVAERRLAYYTKMTRAGGDDARLPRLPLSLEWCQIEVGPWNGHGSGLDLVSPLEGKLDRDELARQQERVDTAFGYPPVSDDQNSEKSELVFDVEIEKLVVLEVDEIWPDGDAPENPTTADVIEKMRKSGFPSLRACNDWSMFDGGVDVYVSGEKV